MRGKAIAPGFGREPVPEEVARNADAVDRVRCRARMAQQPNFVASPHWQPARTPVSVTSSRTSPPRTRPTWRRTSLLKEKLNDVLDTLTERERQVCSFASVWLTVTVAHSRKWAAQFRVTRDADRQIAKQGAGRCATPRACAA